jgi:hypothetical protein
MHEAAAWHMPEPASVHPPIGGWNAGDGLQNALPNIENDSRDNPRDYPVLEKSIHASGLCPMDGSSAIYWLV